MLHSKEAAQAGNACATSTDCIVHHLHVQHIPTPAAAPNLDSVAVGLTSLATAFTLGTIVIGLLALAGGIGWGWYIKLRAERIAEDTVKKICNELVNEWFASEAPRLVRRHVELMMDTTLGNGDDFLAADEIGEKA